MPEQMTIEQLAERTNLSHRLRIEAGRELRIGKFLIKEKWSNVGSRLELYARQSMSLFYMGDIELGKEEETIEAIKALRGCLE